MYQSYDLSRYVDGDLSRSTSLTVSDDDAINCAHMLAAGFNTISRNMMGDFVLAVVDTKAGIVQYDGKTEQINRPDPWSVSQTFTFEPSAGDADTILTLFGNGETPTFTAAGKLKFAEESKYAHVNRDVLEAAYGELEDVKSVLFDAGVETIPADAGVRDLLANKRVMSQQISRRDVEIAELVQERANANEAARAEMIAYLKGARDKYQRLDPSKERDDLIHRFRGMLDVFAKFLVVTGEADTDERHAVARRLCGMEEQD